MKLIVWVFNRFDFEKYGNKVFELKEWFDNELGECTAVRFSTSMTEFRPQE